MLTFAKFATDHLFFNITYTTSEKVHKQVAKRRWFEQLGNNVSFFVIIHSFILSDKPQINLSKKIHIKKRLSNRTAHAQQSV